MKTVLRVFEYLRRYPLLASSTLLCAILMTVLGVVFPQAVTVLIDEIIPNREFDRLVPITLIVAGTFLVTNLLNAFRIILNNTFEQKVIYDIRSDLYHHIQRLPMRWFDNKRTGDVMTRVTEDVTSMERVLIDGIEGGVVAILQILVVGCWMFFKNPALAWIALIPIPLLALGAWIYTRTAPQRYRASRKAVSHMNSLLHDNIDGIQQIKSFTREKPEHARFNVASDAARKATLHVMRIWASYSPSMEFCRNLGYALVLGMGGYWVMQGEVENGVFVGFLVILNMFYEPVTRLHQLNQILQQGRAAGERVFEIFDAEIEPNTDDGVELNEPVKGNVVFDDVHFSYSVEDEAPVVTLQGVTLEAKAGETIALVGHTGAGKSTVINLLTRFYEYGDGLISLDGEDIRGVRKSSLRNAIGYVTQESFLFNGTVRENLELARPDATDEEMWSALESADAEGFVRELPDQLETNVGERGVKLSVGEKQRVAIARVILKNPPILLLDEATASVDTQTEKAIQAALDKLMDQRTSFVIAHRLSTVRNADRIYVMDHGKVIEQGTHDALISEDGHYAKLCRNALMAEAQKEAFVG